MKPRHFSFTVDSGVGLAELNRPEKKNPLTFESYAELRDFFRYVSDEPSVKVVVLTGAGGNFCAGGDVQEIIAPLVRDAGEGRIDDILQFARLTGDLVRAMRACRKPIVAAVDGACVGAGAILAMVADLRLCTPRAKIAFLFTRVGLSGADMGACAILPRLVGAGRAADLLYTGRVMSGEEAERYGFANRIVEPDALLSEATSLARSLASGPTFAHEVTKRCLNQEWSMSVDEAIEAEAQAQTICMMSKDFARAFHAISQRKPPQFEGN